MKTLIFSDTHFSSRFDVKRFNLLMDLINSADQVIINGDFWDYYLTTWNDFLNSDWNKLFPALKKKKTIYIYGNHDKEDWMDSRMDLFSDIRGYKVNINAGNLELLVQHGDRIAPSMEEAYPIIQPFVKLEKLTVRFYDVLASVFGSTYFRFTSGGNRIMKKWAELNLKENQILVCGHTHITEYNLNKKFINTGLVRFGLLQYLIIDEANLELVDRRY